MTSGTKKKADLVALFRLEFYRKQNNWKFCSQVQKSKKASSTDKAPSTAKVVKNKHVERCLNKTYNVEPGKDGEKSVLNEAFLETDDENNYQNCQNITKELSWPENIEKWPQNDSKVMQNWENIPVTVNNDKQFEINNNNFKQHTDWTKNIIPEPIYANMHDCKEAPVSDMAHNLQQIWPSQIINNEAQWQGDEYMELPELDKVGQEGTEAEWPWEAQIRANNQLFPEVIWSDDVLRELELLNLNELSPDEPPEGEKWVPPDRLLQWMLANKECCDSVLETSCESLEQFMRAAHCAPHSSEIDLQPQLDALEASIEACEPVGGAGAGAWSWAALRAAGRGHARALHRVNRELRARERLVGNRDLGSRSVHPPTLTPRNDVSCEEYPTRDIGLQKPAFIDTFISGSHKNNPHNKLLEKSKDLHENNMGYNKNDGPIQVQGGQIVVRDNNKRDQSIMGQTERNLDQRGRIPVQNWGQIEPKNQVYWCKTEPKQCQTAKLRVLGDQIVIDQYNMSPDQTQTFEHETDYQGGFGDYGLIGRGRGRLVKDNKTRAGRGRGRL